MPKKNNRQSVQQQQFQPALDKEQNSKMSEEEQEPIYSSEDQDGVLLTNKVEQKLLSFVAQLKSKNPSIYKIDKPIFDMEDFAEDDPAIKQKIKNENKQKLTYKNMLIQKFRNDGKQQQQEEQNGVEQTSAKIKEKFLSKLKMQEEQQGEMFKIKKKISTKKNDINGNNKMNTFLEQTFSKNGKDNQQSKKLLQNIWENQKNLDETDKFLKNYIVDRKWMASKHAENEIAHHNQQQMIDHEDEERSLQMDEYQMQYNFRYEEPEGNKIVQYPRTIPESMRAIPQTRKQKRKRVEQKKKQSEEQLRREAQQKKQQVKEQILARIQQEQGMQQQNQQNQQSAGHDWFFCDDCSKALAEKQIHYACSQCQDFMLCEECYQIIIHKHPLNRSRVPKGFGPPKQSVAQKMLVALKTCRNCKRKIPKNWKRYEYTDKTYLTSALCQTCYDESNLEIKKKFKGIQPDQVNYQHLLDTNPEKIKQLTCQKDIEQLVDEYMKTQFQDVLSGGLKTKFKYISVKPESYGLSDEQILFGDDKQLNKYVSIKNLVPYQDQERSMKLRNSIYNTKMKSIQKSMDSNKKIIQSQGAKGVRNLRGLGKMRSRAEIMKKRRENMKKKLKVVNISRQEDQQKYLLPKSRLQSYGLAQKQPNQYQ